MNSKRIRWIKLYFNKDLLWLSDLLKNSLFTIKNGRGFIPVSLNNDSIRYHHFYRTESIRKIMDPFGNINEVSNIEYIKTEFIIYKDKNYYIQLINPPRSSKIFRKDINTIVGDHGYLEYIEIKPEIWLGNIASNFKSYKVTHIDIKDINIANKGLAKLNVKSTNDILSETKRFLGNKIYKYDSIEIDFELHNGLLGVMVINNSCSVKYAGIPDDILIPMFNISLSKIS